MSHLLIVVVSELRSRLSNPRISNHSSIERKLAPWPQVNTRSACSCKYKFHILIKVYPKLFFNRHPSRNSKRLRYEKIRRNLQSGYASIRMCIPAVRGTPCLRSIGPSSISVNREPRKKEAKRRVFDKQLRGKWRLPDKRDPIVRRYNFPYKYYICMIIFNNHRMAFRTPPVVPARPATT
jgi:hypothetical protein